MEPAENAVMLGSIRLSSGRRLDYIAIGPVASPVVLYCHGTPGSRFELLLARSALQRARAQMRLIAFNRPGYGRSSFVPYGGFLPWAEIVDEAADHLGLSQFGVLGASGGSPFALACAYSLADRIDRVGIIAGVAPPETPGMNQAAALSSEYASSVLRGIRYGSLSLVARVGLAAILTRRLIASLGPADRQALADPSARESLERVVREAFGQCGRGAAMEAGLLMRPWDFDPRRITQQVRLWHGIEDTRIPADVATALAERLPNADCVLWPDHGHFSWAMSENVASVAEFLATPSTG